MKIRVWHILLGFFAGVVWYIQDYHSLKLEESQRECRLLGGYPAQLNKNQVVCFSKEIIIELKGVI